MQFKGLLNLCLLGCSPNKPPVNTSFISVRSPFLKFCLTRALRCMFLTKQLRLHLAGDLRQQCSTSLSIIPSAATESWSHFSTNSHWLLVGGATCRLPPSGMDCPNRKKRYTPVENSGWRSGLAQTGTWPLQRSRWEAPVILPISGVLGAGAFNSVKNRSH